VLFLSLRHYFCSKMLSLNHLYLQDAYGSMLSRIAVEHFSAAFLNSAINFSRHCNEFNEIT